MREQPGPARVSGAVEGAVEHVDRGQRGHRQGDDPQHRHAFLQHLVLPSGQEELEHGLPLGEEDHAQDREERPPSIQAVRADRAARSGRRRPGTGR